MIYTMNRYTYLTMGCNYKMVKIDLLLKARCEGISSISLDPEYPIYFRIQCGRCETPAENEVYISLTESSTKEDTRGTFNFMMKVISIQCKFCRNDITVNVADKLRPYTPEREFIPLVSFDIRGGEITSWIARKNFIVISETDSRYEDVDLSPGDWCEYDEELVRSSQGGIIGVYDVEPKVARSQPKTFYDFYDFYGSY